VISPPLPNDPRLLVTYTKEPFQPVRLYYTIPSKPVVTQILGGLRCTVQEPAGRTWQWLYQNEAAAITFGIPYAEVPAEVQPVIIGRFKFPEPKRMVVEVRSIQRAIEAAKFFGPILGERVVLRRTRVINRWLNGDEATGGLDRLDRHLDANVVVIDPEKTAADLDRLMAKFDTKRERRAAWEAYHEARRHEHVPLVEDFPLAPEEETPEFRDLNMTLMFRAIHAWEHWRGNKDLTLSDVIHKTIEDGFAKGAFDDIPLPVIQDD
jgi:hypothetical protein